MVISSVIGTSYAVLLPYVSFDGDIFVKVALSIIMVFVAFGTKSIKDYIRQLIVFYVITFLFGGTMIGMTYLFSSDFINIFVFPTSLIGTYISLCILAIVAITRYLVALYRNTKSDESCEYDVIISNNRLKIRTNGYLDTGNKLCLGVFPVIVVSDEVFSKIIDVESNKANYIDLTTINGKTRSPVYRVDLVELIQDSRHKYYNNVYIMKSSSDFGRYKILLHSTM